MTSVEITSIDIKYFIIAGIIYYLIYAVSSYFLRKKALQRIKNQLQEDEHIVLETQNDFVIDIIAPFLLGGFIGVYIYPFFINPEIQYIKASYTGSINREYLPLCITAVFIVTLAYFWIGCMKFVLTNKRMIYAWAFKFLYKYMSILGKFEYLYYSDIKTFRYDSVLMTKLIDVCTKNNRRYWIAGYKKLDEIKSIIEKYC